MELDNCIGEHGNEEMACYRETYTYLDSFGNVQKIRIKGVDKAATDSKFQVFLKHLEENKLITLDNFINTVYYKGFLPKKASVVTTYKFFISKYISPKLGAKYLTDITVYDIQDMMDWMANGSKNGLRKDIVAGTIDRVKGLLSHIFNIAIDMKYMNDNPVKSTLLKNNGTDSEHHVALTDEDITEVKKKIPSLPNERQRLCMGLIAYTGMRPEEIRGLMWDDIHCEEQYIEVKRAVTYAGKGRHANVDTPKSKSSIRTVYIPKPLLDIFNGSKKEGGYIIHGKDNYSPIPQATWKRMIDSAFECLGIKGKYVPYDFRATYATQFKENGMTSAQVADLMGHADTRMVETIYARTRHQSIMKHAKEIEELNKAFCV